LRADSQTAPRPRGHLNSTMRRHPRATSSNGRRGGDIMLTRSEAIPVPVPASIGDALAQVFRITVRRHRLRLSHTRERRSGADASDQAKPRLKRTSVRHSSPTLRRSCGPTWGHVSRRYSQAASGVVRCDAYHQAGGRSQDADNRTTGHCAKHARPPSQVELPTLGPQLSGLIAAEPSLLDRRHEGPIRFLLPNKSAFSRIILEADMR
jgi:hypothetical protein